VADTGHNVVQAPHISESLPEAVEATAAFAIVNGFAEHPGFPEVPGFDIRDGTLFDGPIRDRKAFSGSRISAACLERLKKGEPTPLKPSEGTGLLPAPQPQSPIATAQFTVALDDEDANFLLKSIVLGEYW
jgi:hypothetical protein